MTGSEELTDEAVLNHLSRTTGPASLREIAHALHLRHPGRRQLPKIIQRLKGKGEVEEVRSGRYRLAGKTPALRGPKGSGGPPARLPVPARPAGGRQAGGELEAKQARGTPTKSLAASRTSGEPSLISGRLVTHRDGYGFVVPDQPIPALEGDLFIGRDHLGDAMHGDQVVARIERRRGDGRAEGRIVRVVKRAHPTVVGIFQYGGYGNRVAPYDTRLLHEIIIPPGDELTPGLREKLGMPPGKGGAGRRAPRLPELDGAVVNVELTRFPRGGAAPAGRVVEILGRPGDFGVDVEIIIRKHHLPSEFPEEAKAPARAAPQQVGARDLEGRRDFRKLPIVTIDGETARDFDDAVHVSRLPHGHFELQVHIADVAHYVRRGSPLDREARLRGTSVYFPDRAIPMLPEELSSGICSLNPKVNRLVMSVLLEIDSRGQVVKTSFTPGVIRSAERMTYTNVNKVLEGDPEMSERYAHLADQFRQMRDLALLLNAQRARRGSIDFDLPEPVIEFDELGRMVKIVRSERNIAHRIIEEFMLAANEAVARYLEARAISSLHRVHEKPDPKKVLEFEELARAFGYSLGVASLAERRIPVKHGRVLSRTFGTGSAGRPPAGRAGIGRGRERAMMVSLPAMELNITPHHYQRLTEKIAGKPEERILSYLMLRSLKQARYATEPLGHFALGMDQYTHFTSPIRRYPDLIVHRVLEWALEHPAPARKQEPDKPAKNPARAGPASPYGAVELEEIALESSEAERRADAAERELMDWKTAQFMEARLGEEFEALIISVQKFGFFVELMDVFVEGLVPVDTLEEAVGEPCFYRERDHAIVSARARRTFRLGDRVRVCADRIDYFRHRVEFSVVR